MWSNCMITLEVHGEELLIKTHLILWRFTATVSHNSFHTCPFHTCPFYIPHQVVTLYFSLPCEAKLMDVLQYIGHCKYVSAPGAWVPWCCGLGRFFFSKCLKKYGKDLRNFVHAISLGWGRPSSWAVFPIAPNGETVVELPHEILSLLYHFWQCRVSQNDTIICNSMICCPSCDIVALATRWGVNLGVMPKNTVLLQLAARCVMPLGSTWYVCKI